VPQVRAPVFWALTWATLPSASGLGRRRRGFPLLRVLASWTLITFGTLHAQAAGLHFSHGLHYHQTKYRCMQCELTEEKCQCEKYCCLCQSQIDIRLCQDGLYYCPPCREACDYRVSG